MAKRGAPRKPVPMHQIFISVPSDKKRELQKLADETYSSLSQVARECLLRGLEQRQQS